MAFMVFLILLQFFVLSPSYGQDSTSLVIERAMEDELKRSMKELSYEGYEKPFFISYRVNDIKGISVSATLGALVYSYQYPMRDKSVRVLVGDYNFNDESLDVASYSGYSPSLNEIGMPVGDDYFGIRRSLWGTTDAVYKSAAKGFEESKQYVKEQSIPFEELPHRRFVKAPVVQINFEGPKVQVKKEQLEDIARELSAMFKKEGEIENSMVSFNTYQSTTYFLNSEGSRVRYPSNVSSVQIFAEIKTEQGESLYDSFEHYSFTPEGLPDKDSLQREITDLIERLKVLKKTKVFEDSYFGPVLFTGESAASVFALNLFGYKGLVASNDISTRNDYSYNGFSIDDKVGKKILANELTIQSLPKLTTFNGVDLVGSFPIDAEGVIPPDELTLVKEGTLLALLNDRTTSQKDHVLNGHSSDYRAVAPGVIKISAKNGNSLPELKSRLIELAKEEGLPYAVMVKKIPYGSYMSVNIYKVSVEDGTEELVRLAQVGQLSMKSFRNIKGLSKNHLVYTAETGGRGLSSFIVPDGLLLEDVEVEGSKGPYLGTPTYVVNPLKDQKEK